MCKRDYWLLSFFVVLYFTFLFFLVYNIIKNPPKQVSVVTVDGCEYIHFHREQTVVHKANCKNHGKGER